MRFRALAFAVLLVVAASAAVSPSGRRAAVAAPPADERTGAFVVQFREDATLAGVGDAITGAATDATASSAPSRLVRLEPQDGQTVDAALADLRTSGSVVFAEPERVVHIAQSPNDTYYGSQWHYPQINLPQAWDITTGNANVIVAVIDTGVMVTHPDLDSKITSGGNAGYDFQNSDADPTDDNGHGTFVAGIIGAESNNASWISGVCWLCKIMPVKALDATGNGSTFNVAAGVDWARTHGADVINLSLGSTSNDATLATAVTNAWNAGIPVVAATGNTNAAVLYPAANANTIAVGSNDSAGNRSSFSNFGPTIDIVAPGENVVSTILGGGYGAGSGTSFATPHVAGVIGLMMANGITDPATILARLQTTAPDMGAAGFDNLTGWGRINAPRAVDKAPTVSVTAPANSTTVGGRAVSVTATAADDLAVSKVRFEADGALISEDTTAPYSASWNSTGVIDGAHTLSAKAYDGLAQITTASVAVTVGNNDLTLPAASITAPGSGATISGSAVAFTATASDNVGVTKVRFWAGTTYLGYDSAAPFARTLDTTLLPNGKTTLKIEALDAANNSRVVTRQVTIINPDSTPPTIVIDAPADLATVSGSLVTIAATPSDTQGVQKVQFWAGATYVGYDDTAPYSKTFDSTLLANGALVLKARAVDWGGNMGEDTVSVTVNNNDTTPPSVAAGTPGEGDTVSATVSISATASDDVAVNKVRFWIDGTYLGYDSAAPYTRSWDSTSVSNGAHQLKLQAVDNAGNASTILIVNITVSN